MLPPSKAAVALPPCRSKGASEQQLPLVESPQSSPARADSSCDAPVFVDLRSVPKENRSFSGGDGPGFAPAKISAELQSCYHERQQKRARLRKVGGANYVTLKRGALGSIRDPPLYGPYRGNVLLAWMNMPYKITRCRLRMFEALSDGPWHPRRKVDTREPWEGELRMPFRVRMDWQFQDSRNKAWWETLASFRCPSASPKLSLNEEREIISRTLPKTCRHLVVWGADSALPKLESRTSSIECLVNSLIHSPLYKEAYGDCDDARCHASLPIDRREIPWPLKLLRGTRPTANPNNVKLTANVCEFRSMFSSFLESYRGERWNFAPSEESLRPPFEMRQRVWTGVIEFVNHDACADFFDATTYTNLDTNNLNAVPDEMGVKYWLHTILSTSIAATKLKPNRRTPDTPRQTWWDSNSSVWAPFLTADDLAQAPWPADCARVLPGRDSGVEINGSCLRLCALSATKGDETVTVVVHNESKPMVQNYLNITGMLPSQTPLARVPRYIVQLWKKPATRVAQEELMMQDEETRVEHLVIDDTHKYGARVALLIFPVGRLLVISPCLLCARHQFFSAQIPHIIDRGPSALAPIK